VRLDRVHKQQSTNLQLCRGECLLGAWTSAHSGGREQLVLELSTHEQISPVSMVSNDTTPATAWVGADDRDVVLVCHTRAAIMLADGAGQLPPSCHDLASSSWVLLGVAGGSQHSCQMIASRFIHADGLLPCVNKDMRGGEWALPFCGYHSCLGARQ